MWQTILFDLDGTLTDSAEGIVRSMQHALESVGARVEDPRVLRASIGQPLRRTFMETAHLSEEDAQRAAEAYREYYATQGIYMGRPYPLVAEMLAALRRSGRTLGVVTSRETLQAVEILRRFNLAGYFDVIYGCRPEEPDVSKSALIEQTLAVLGKENRRGEVVVVGDRYYDMQGAQGAGVGAVGAAYGYGSAQELTENGADCVAGNITELTRTLLSGSPETARGIPRTFGQRLAQIAVPLLIWMGINIVVSSIAGGIFGAIVTAQGMSAGQDPSVIGQELLQGAYASQLSVMYMIALGFTDGICIPVFYAMYKKDVFRTMGIRTSLRTEKKPGWVNALLVFLMGLSISVVLNVLIGLTGISEWMYETNPSRYDMLGSLPLWGQFLTTCILAPIAEELLFRAVIFRRVRRFAGFVTAAVVSAAVFGAVHFDLVTGLSAFLIGIIMAMLYEYTGSIFTSMLFHFGFNFYATGMELFGITALPEEQAGVVVLILIIAAVIVGTASFVIFFKKNRNQA